MMKRVEKIIYVCCLVVLAWLIASFIDINMHNLSDLKYHSWNMFRILLEKR